MTELGIPVQVVRSPRLIVETSDNLSFDQPSLLINNLVDMSEGMHSGIRPVKTERCKKICPSPFLM